MKDSQSGERRESTPSSSPQHSRPQNTSSCNDGCHCDSGCGGYWCTHLPRREGEGLGLKDKETQDEVGK